MIGRLAKSPAKPVIKARPYPLGQSPAASVLKVLDQKKPEDIVAGPARFVPKLVRDAATHARNTETLRRLAYLAEGRAQRPQ